MTYFDPTPSEFLFRLWLSLAGLAMIAVAVALRGLPEDATVAALCVSALAFLCLSAGVSGRKLRAFRDG